MYRPIVAHLIDGPAGDHMTGSWSISPLFTNAKLVSGKIEDKIDVFEDQISGWLLRHAQALCSGGYSERANAGFAVLAIVGSYFEAIESYHCGFESRGKSKRFFRGGFLKVFPDLPASLKASGHSSPGLDKQIADDVYEQLRCGLFHEALAKHRVLIRKDTAPIGFMLEKTTGEVGSIIIDPEKFVAAVSNHFQHYLAVLRDSAQTSLRLNFERFFDLRSGRGPFVEPPAVGSRGTVDDTV